MLRRIALRGFKSFADPVNLDLGPGLNVIVGPNGSGKSNLAEAIIWALGEQRPAKLRAPAMQDMLYSGSGDRPAAGFAEIALQFEADADAGHPEAEVSRRLTRNGDAVYRLGQTACRLLDVQETLSARGLGADSLAVIRQGQVEAIATSKPEARRAMLDEAAGVGVAKRRRRRAEQKLARVAEKLDRARDLAAELNGRARALDRQARAAERAAELERRIDELRRSERDARARAAAAQLDRASSDHTQLQALDAAAAAALVDARTAREAATAARATATAALERVDSAAQRLRSVHDRISGRAELARERVEELEARQERLGFAKADAARRLTELEAAERAVTVELMRTRQALEAAQAMLTAAERDELAARSDEMAAGDRVRRTGEELAAAQNARADAEHRVQQADLAATRAQTALDELGVDDPEAHARGERRLEIAERRVHRDRGRVDGAQAALDEIAAELRSAEQRLREASSSVRLLAPDASTTGGPAMLGDGLEVEPGTERAVAAALGAAAEAIVADGVAEARRALADGVATVVVPVDQGAATAAPAAARPLTTLITACPAATRPHVERLLAAAWLVDDLDDVPPGHEGIFVTLDGVAMTPRTGVVAAGRGEWAKRALHRRAVADEATARAAVAAMDERSRTGVRERDARRARLVASERVHARLSAAAASRRAAATAAEQRRDRLVADHAESMRQREDGARAVAEWARACVSLEEDLARARHDLAAARERAAAAAAELDSVRAAVRDARAAGSAVDARAGEIQSQAASARALLGAADVLPEGLAAVARAAEALTEARSVLEPAVERAGADVAAEREHFSQVEQRVAEAHRGLDDADAIARAARERLHAAAVELRVAQERVAEAGPVADDAPDEELDPDAVAAELADLERRRLNIGAVNELAASERVELAEREELLTEQIDDLERSSASLTAHLGELDTAVDEGFEAIFTAVSERFAEVIGWLFPGGTGVLRLVAPDDEDGDQGVEVEVVPAGKRPRPMTLMSGGERSLIAMAFMLSLAMSRPAPFYLLDEVEAALDDANLRRFLGVLRRLAGETQFIVITHQQPTVEIADTLFGVTMGSSGVSQIVSRRLAQTVEGPARPYVRRQLRLVGS